VIIQNDLGNKHSPTVIAAAITSQLGKNKLPTHIEIGPENTKLKTESIVLTEQIRTIDKSRLKEKIGHIDDEKIIDKVNNALGVSFGLEE
jgi:mRNA interferase MazF